MDLMHLETRYKDFDYDRVKSAEFIQSLSDNDQFIYLLDGCLMLGYISETFFGKSNVAGDLLLYVVKEERNKGKAKKAVKAFIDWAESKNCDNIVISQSSGINNKEFASMATANGFNKIGETFAR